MGSATTIRTKLRHIITSDWARSDNVNFTWGFVYPLVTIWSSCVYDYMCGFSIDARDVSDAIRWMCATDTLLVGVKLNRAWINLCKFRSQRVMVCVSKSNIHPKNSNCRSLKDLFFAIDPSPKSCCTLASTKLESFCWLAIWDTAIKSSTYQRHSPEMIWEHIACKDRVKTWKTWGMPIQPNNPARWIMTMSSDRRNANSRQ